MVLRLSLATAEDVEQITTIHLASFESNPLVHAQFPSPASLASLHSVLRQGMLSAMENNEDAGRAVLVVRDSTENDRIISFAKWDLPGVQDSVQSGFTWHEDVRQEYLNGYHQLAETAKERVVGDTPFYRLTFVGTLPSFQGRGAATMLTKWGLSRAEKENVPVYLESSLAASSLYRKLGFIVVDGLAMALPKTSDLAKQEYYQEVCMLRTWDTDENDLGQGHWDSSLNISSLLMDYDAGIRPQQVIEAIYDRIEIYQKVQPSVWIYLQPIGEVLAAAHAIQSRWPDPQNRPPLWGVPFSVKDSIDVAGIPTTIGCPALAFTPTVSAPVYQRCIDDGALFIGKTNMEQLATGMTGCRSPFGTLHSTFSNKHIVGGSSSGSAVTVGQQLVSFSLGSDTAGSIRVPASYNGVVGFKPTKGTVSARGVYPACQHQDCVSFLTSTAEDAEVVWKSCRGYDKHDSFSKRLPASPEKLSGEISGFRFGVPPDSALAQCSSEYRRKFEEVIRVLKIESGELAALDWAPFGKANELLYNGSFVLERVTILPDGWFDKNKELLHPITREVFESALARNSTAVDVFRDLHKQAEFKRAVEEILTLDHDSKTGEDLLTVMVVPTAPCHPTIEDVKKDPIGINGKLGAFAHFANVLDLVAIALPCGTYEVESGVDKERIELPFGVTILAGCGFDQHLMTLTKKLEEALRDLGQDD